MKVIRYGLFGLAVSVYLLLWSYVGFWKYVHEPIDDAAFSRGVSVGISLQQCGVKPLPDLVDKLRHFVEGDVATHNCSVLRSEAAQ
jgi:hypothetical protein